ncbi:unnamed protein product [Symbiodinium microadriaticum]|nr:unnamed protein product [Symbiodinium microadriaticum]
MRDCLLMFITCLFLMLSSAGIWRLAIGRAYIFRVQVPLAATTQEDAVDFERALEEISASAQVDPEWENGVQKAMMLVQSDFGDDAANTLLRQDVLQASEDMGLDLGELMEAHPDKAPLGPRASLAQAASTQFSLELGQWEGRLDVLGAVGGLNSGRVLFATFAIAGMWTAREMANGVLQMLPSSITDGVRRFELSVLFNAQGLPEVCVVARRSDPDGSQGDACAASLAGIWEAGTAVALVAAACLVSIACEAFVSPSARPAPLGAAPKAAAAAAAPSMEAAGWGLAAAGLAVGAHAGLAVAFRARAARKAETKPAEKKYVETVADERLFEQVYLQYTSEYLKGPLYWHPDKLQGWLPDYPGTPMIKEGKYTSHVIGNLKAFSSNELAFLSMLFFGVGLYGNLQFNFYDPQWAKVDAGGFFNVSYIVESFLLPISFFMHIACYIQRQNGK